jgi:hypothetical protein
MYKELEDCTTDDKNHCENIQNNNPSILVQIYWHFIEFKEGNWAH